MKRARLGGFHFTTKYCGMEADEVRWMKEIKKALQSLDYQGFKSAREEIRTLTPFRALPPQSSASTNFATHAAEVCRECASKKLAHPSKYANYCPNGQAADGRFGFELGAKIGLSRRIFKGGRVRGEIFSSGVAGHALRRRARLRGYFFRTMRNVVPLPNSECRTKSCPL